MPLVDLGPAPVKKKDTGLVDLGPAPTPITEALTAVEQPTEERPPLRFEATPEPEMPTLPYDPSQPPMLEEYRAGRGFEPSAVERGAVAAFRATGIPKLLPVKEAGLVGGAAVPSPEELAKMPWHKKIPEAVGWTAMELNKLAASYGILRGIGLLQALPAKAGAIAKAGEMAKWFGGTEALRQVGKGLAKKLTGEDFDYEGATAVLKSAGIGMLVSFAFSGAGAIWHKLHPSEQMWALRTLGLKRGATPEQITKAARREVMKYHPDKIKGMREQFEKVIKARDTLRKGEFKDIIFRGKKITPPAQITGGVAPTVAKITPTKPKAAIKPVIKGKPPKVAPVAKKLDKLQEMIKKHPGTLTVAVKLDSGEIISDPKVGNHGELLDKYNLDLNKVADGGFVVGGEYISSITDAKRPSPEVIAAEALERKPAVETKDEYRARIRAAKPKLVDLGPAKAAEVEIRDLSEKTRKKQVKQTEDAISKYEIYQLEMEGIEAAEREIGPGYYYVPKNLKGEILQVTGKPGQKGFKPQLYKSFTFKSGTIATSWAKAAQIAGLDDIDISEFVQRVDEAIQAKKKIGVLNARALERAIASGDPYFEALAMKREMLKDGLTSAEINDNIKEQAKYYKMPEEAIADLLVPVERVEYVEKKPRVAPKVAAKGQAAKAKLGPEQTALTKAKQVARKLKQPTYLYQKADRFIVSKNPPKTPKLSYRVVQPPEAGKLVQEVSWQTVPEKPVLERPVLERPNVVMVNDVKKRFAEKGLLSKNDKLKNNAKRLAKVFTGKTDLNRMTEEELAKLGPMVDALPVDYRGVARVPTSTDIITKELADKIGKFKEIGALEKIRPAWRVFQKMGLYKEVFEPAFDAEISSIEELFGFRAEAKQMQKLIGKDKPTSLKLFRAIENPGKIKLTSKEAKVVKWGQKYFRDWADRLGLTAEHRRKNYITHIFEREIDQLLKEKHPLDPDLIRALEFITPKTVFNPYLQKRLGKKVGLKEDFWAAIEAYENRAIKKFYYEPLIKRVRVYQRFLPPNSARYLRNYITRITKRPLTIDREVNQTLKEVARDISKLPGGKKLAQHLTKGNAAGMLAYNMTGIYYEAWLGLRPASAIKNLSQHGLVLAETGPVAFTRALKTVGTKRASLLLNSKVLRSRKSGYLPGIDQTYIKNLESKRRKITMAMFRAADRQNVSDAFLAGYHEAKAKDLSDEWAFKRGDEVAAKTQWLYSKFAGAEFMQTSPGRVLGVLTTWPENWAELMNDWIRAKPSQVYTDYAKETGGEIPKVNWAKRRKSLWTYLALVSLAMLIHKKTPFKAMYYTGWTSLGALADIARGKLAGLNVPGMVADFVVGLATLDKRRLKRAWNEAKRFVVIQKELRDIITGKKDWINLFIYMETKKEKKEGKRKTRMEREKRMLRPTRPTRPSR